MKARMMTLSLFAMLCVASGMAQLTGISGSAVSGLTLQGQTAVAGSLGGTVPAANSAGILSEGLSLPLYPDDQDDPAYVMYKEGYKHIVNEQWDTARKQFELLLKKYPKSKYAGDARYWTAYSLKYSDRKKAIAAYKAFLEAYPQSNYYDDAVSDLGRLENRGAVVAGAPKAYTLGVPLGVATPGPAVARAEAEYARAARLPGVYTTAEPYQAGSEKAPSPEVRMKVEAFMALIRSGRDEKTFDMVKEVLLDPKQPIELRETALMGLRQVEEQARSWSETARSEGQSPAMRDVARQAIKNLEKKDIPAIYLQILKSDSSKKLSRTVLYQLGYYAERGDDRALATLKQTALDVKQDRELREAALMGLRGSKQSGLLNIYAEILKKDPDMRLRQFAIYQIGHSDGSNEDAAYKLLSEYALDKSESRDLREAALSSLRSVRGSKAAALYLDVAKNDPDERIQQMALYLYVDASKGEPEKAFATLKDIILDRKRSWTARESAMSMLTHLNESDVNKDEVLGLLVTVAKSEPEERVRMSAINYISHLGKNKTKSLQTLISLYEGLPKDQTNTQSSLLYGIASVGNDEAIDFLGKIAKTHENLEVRRSAIQFLGNIGGDKARSILVEILQGK